MPATPLRVEKHRFSLNNNVTGAFSGLEHVNREQERMIRARGGAAKAARCGRGKGSPVRAPANKKAPAAGRGAHMLRYLLRYSDETGNSK